jgi:hypothetical protein
VRAVLVGQRQFKAAFPYNYCDHHTTSPGLEKAPSGDRAELKQFSSTIGLGKLAPGGPVICRPVKGLFMGPTLRKATRTAIVLIGIRVHLEMMYHFVMR